MTMIFPALARYWGFQKGHMWPDIGDWQKLQLVAKHYLNPASPQSSNWRWQPQRSRQGFVLHTRRQWSRGCRRRTGNPAASSSVVIVPASPALPSGSRSIQGNGAYTGTNNVSELTLFPPEQAQQHHDHLIHFYTSFYELQLWRITYCVSISFFPPHELYLPFISTSPHHCVP